jgi:hypothetical protein
MHRSGNDRFVHVTHEKNDISKQERQVKKGNSRDNGNPAALSSVCRGSADVTTTASVTSAMALIVAGVLFVAAVTSQGN